MHRDNASSLRVYMNWLTLEGLPEFQCGPLQAIRDAGYDGVQFIPPVSPQLVEMARKVGLGVCSSGRVDHPRDADNLAREARDLGLECLTVHVGSGLEGDSEAVRLIEAVLEASRHGLPLYPETHRATIFQDMWRAVQYAQRFPELRFNADFSHWYTGSEMVYGGFQEKLKFIHPVLDRVRFLHGRIGNPGCMQVDVGDGNIQTHPYVNHFRILWTAAFLGALQNEPDPKCICFAVELLSPSRYYARMFQGVEESDRWQQSLVIARIAQECFKIACEQREQPSIGVAG